MSEDTLDAEAMAEEIAAAYRSIETPTLAELRRLRREYSKQLRPALPRDIFALATALYGMSDVRRFFADELIANHAQARAAIARKELETFGRRMDTWDEVDCFSGYLSGPAWRNGQIGDDVITEWALSPDRWWRRAALVSTVALNVKTRGGTGDAPRTLAVCEMLIADRDDMVVKAMSWALRALAERDTEAVAVFVRENRAELAPRVVREVGNKLRTGLKNPKPGG